LDGDGIGFSFGLNFFLLPLLFAPVVLALASLVDDVSVSFPVEAAASSTVITSPRPADDDDVADEEEDGGGPIRDAAEDGMAWAGLRRALFGHDVGEFLSSEKIQTHNMYVPTQRRWCQRQDTSLLSSFRVLLREKGKLSSPGEEPYVDGSQTTNS
jgi:hypothetical protein